MPGPRPATVALIVLLAACDHPPPPPAEAAAARSVAAAPLSTTDTGTTAIGVKALDGDSIIVRKAGREVEVRLLSIDAQERGQPLADAARSETRRAIVGRSLRLVTGPEKHDRYGRLLAFVFVGDTLVNEALVEAGLAVAYFRAPNIAQADVILAAQKRAHAARRGLWQEGKRYEEPRSARERKRGWSVTKVWLKYSRWTIIGNRRTKLAHWPGCRHVDSMSSGNRVRFESIAEPVAAGYSMEKGYR